MQPGLFSSRGPWHLIAYGILTGSEFFQSFIAGIVSYKALPRAQFSQLQKAIFPVYFAMQTVLPIVLCWTFPADRTAIGMSSAGFEGVFELAHRRTVLAPFATIFVTSLINLVYLGPKSAKVMTERKHQETRDGKRYYDPGPQSKQMRELNDQFFWLHSTSSTLNIIGCAASIWYGFYLGDRLT